VHLLKSVPAMKDSARKLKTAVLQFAKMNVETGFAFLQEFASAMRALSFQKNRTHACLKKNC